MARIFNQTPFALDVIPLIDKDGRTVALVIVKATYQIEPSGELVPATDQIPVLLTDEYLEDPAWSEMRVPSDLTDFKPAAEVILIRPNNPLEKTGWMGRVFSVEVGSVSFSGTTGEPWDFGPVRRDEVSRRRFAGTYDQAWKENRIPLLPEDFDPRFNQAARTHQIKSGYFSGNERLRLRGYFAAGHTVDTYLPGQVMIVAGNVLQNYFSNPAVLDTVLIWTEKPLVSLVWRYAIPTHQKFEEVCNVHIYSVRLRTAREIFGNP